MFVKHGCPQRQQVHNLAKISKSYILTKPHPLNIALCKLDGQTDGRKDDLIPRSFRQL